MDEPNEETEPHGQRKPDEQSEPIGSDEPGTSKANGNQTETAEQTHPEDGKESDEKNQSDEDKRPPKFGVGPVLVWRLKEPLPFMGELRELEVDKSASNPHARTTEADVPEAEMMLIADPPEVYVPEPDVPVAIIERVHVSGAHEQNQDAPNPDESNSAARGPDERDAGAPNPGESHADASRAALAAQVAAASQALDKLGYWPGRIESATGNAAHPCYQVRYKYLREGDFRFYPREVRDDSQFVPPTGHGQSGYDSATEVINAYIEVLKMADEASIILVLDPYRPRSDDSSGDEEESDLSQEPHSSQLANVPTARSRSPDGAAGTSNTAATGPEVRAPSPEFNGAGPSTESRRLHDASTSSAAVASEEGPRARDGTPFTVPRFTLTPPPITAVELRRNYSKHRFTRRVSHSVSADGIMVIPSISSQIKRAIYRESHSKGQTIVPRRDYLRVPSASAVRGRTMHRRTMARGPYRWRSPGPSPLVSGGRPVEAVPFLPPNFPSPTKSPATDQSKSPSVSKATPSGAFQTLKTFLTGSPKKCATVSPSPPSPVRERGVIGRRTIVRGPCRSRSPEASPLFRGGRPDEAGPSSQPDFPSPKKRLATDQSESSSDSKATHTGTFQTLKTFLTSSPKKCAMGSPSKKSRNAGSSPSRRGDSPLRVLTSCLSPQHQQRSEEGDEPGESNGVSAGSSRLDEPKTADDKGKTDKSKKPSPKKGGGSSLA